MTFLNVTLNGVKGLRPCKTRSFALLRMTTSEFLKIFSSLYLSSCINGHG